MPNATRKLHARICPKLSLQAHTERGNTHTLVVASHKVTWQSSLLRCVGLHKPPLDCGVGLFTSLLAMTRSMRRKWAVWFTLRFRDASHNAVIARHEVVWQSSQDRLTPRCHCEPVRAWQSSLLRCVGLPKRPLDCRVAPFGSPRNDNVKTGGFPTVPLDCRVGAFTLLAMTKWDGGRCGSRYGLGTPPTMLSLRAR